MAVDKTLTHMVIFAVCICFVHGYTPVLVEYTEIENLNATCSIDKCNDSTISNTFTHRFDPEFDSLLFRKCECGLHCAKYDTCCIDSPNLVHTWEIRNGTVSHACIELPVNLGVTQWLWMIDKCTYGWHGNNNVRDMCERVAEIRDPFMVIPAHDKETNTTYKNFFCGLCNGVEPDRLKLWNIILKKSLIHMEEENGFLERLIFNESSNAWGTWEMENDHVVFAKVYIHFVESKSAHVCIPNLISDCDRLWRNDTTRQKCLTYMAPMYIKRSLESRSPRYRNVHCAICNFEIISNNVECVPPPVAFNGTLPSVLFPLLLDVNIKDGDEVGKINRCGKGETYDPFFKKCRALECGIPGFVMKNGHCTRS